MSQVLFQALPPLSPEEYRDLEESILTNGVKVPIVVDENGVVIDGHHRQKIVSHHNLECPVIIESGLTDTAKRSLALSLNLKRRHLNQAQKRALLEESIKTDPQLSDREHGRRTGVSKNTAADVRDELEESGQIDHFSERTDPRTGKQSQPASKLKPNPTTKPPKSRATESSKAKKASIDLQKAIQNVQQLVKSPKSAHADFLRGTLQYTRDACDEILAEFQRANL